MRSLMKGLVSGKITGDSEVMLASKECSAVLQNRPIKKLGDPGKFVLSIQIGKTMFACSLCVMGSSVNLMPYSVAKRLGFTDFKPTRISLVFADRSVVTGGYSGRCPCPSRQHLCSGRFCGSRA